MGYRLEYSSIFFIHYTCTSCESVWVILLKVPIENMQRVYKGMLKVLCSPELFSSTEERNLKHGKDKHIFCNAMCEMRYRPYL